MPFVTRSTLFTLVLLAGIALVAAAGFVWSGVYNVGADDPHLRPVYALLQAARERSIDVRAHKLPLPANLDDPARIRQGAGNYDAMCTECHLTPGAGETELSKGLYPAPPNLTREPVDVAEAFWAIKHGIKASGMPAWGKSMEDEYIWNMAAFLQELPKLDKARYEALVASSGGHSHSGGETDGHSHGGESAAPSVGENDHHAPTASEAGTAAQPAGTTHVHADGKRHVHAPEPAETAVESETGPEPNAPAHEEPQHDHDHQH